MKMNANQKGTAVEIPTTSTIFSPE